MKKLVLSAVASVALAGPTLAADLPMKAPPMVAAPVFSWTGLLYRRARRVGLWPRG